MLKKLIMGLCLYGPPFLFGIASPLIIFNFGDSSKNMMDFYSAIFGIGIVSSGFSNSIQYIIAKYDNDLNFIQSFVNSYIVSRLALFVLLSPLFYLKVELFGHSYNLIFFTLLILCSLPGWPYLFSQGYSKVPIIIVWSETFLKLLCIFYFSKNDIDIWYFLIVTGSINLIITICLIFKNNAGFMSLREFFSVFSSFVGGGVIFSLSWLAFMSVLLASNVGLTSVNVFLERTLRILERVSTILTTFLFRVNSAVVLSDYFKKRVLKFVFISTIPLCLILVWVGSNFGYLVAFFLTCMMNVFVGQALQQLIRPNKLFNIGGVVQAMFLFVAMYFVPEDINIIIISFFFGAVLNYCIRVISVSNWSYHEKL